MARVAANPQMVPAAGFRLRPIKGVMPGVFAAVFLAGFAAGFALPGEPG
jgi:hypothetical protein